MNVYKEVNLGKDLRLFMWAKKLLLMLYRVNFI